VLVEVHVIAVCPLVAPGYVCYVAVTM